jgi:hypothetical protein
VQNADTSKGPAWDAHAGGSCHFLVIGSERERFGWVLINPIGTPTARSTHLYPTDDEARRAAERARAQIGVAAILDSIDEGDVRK